MKPISIDTGIYLSSVTLKRDHTEPNIIEVYDARTQYSHFIGNIFMREWRFVFLLETSGKKYYRLESKKNDF